MKGSLFQQWIAHYYFFRLAGPLGFINDFQRKGMPTRIFLGEMSARIFASGMFAAQILFGTGMRAGILGGRIFAAATVFRIKVDCRVLQQTFESFRRLFRF